MKLDIEKKDLLNLIGKTQNIVEKKNTMQVLVNVLLEAVPERLKVYATDLEISLTDHVFSKTITPGKVVISAKSLFEIARRLSEGPISLTKKENNWLEIKQGKYVSKIVGISSDDYPIFPSLSSQSSVRIPCSVLRDMIDKTIYSVSTDETRYHLNGVYFEVQNALRMIATDGHRMSLVQKEDLNLKNPVNTGVIIPRKGLYEARKILEGVESEVEFAVEGPQIILSFQSMNIMIRLIEGKYPNYQQFIPQKLVEPLVLDKEAFLNSLERVALLANQKSKAILLHVFKNKVEISSHNPDLGDAKEELEAEYSGSEMKIGFNAKYLIDILSNIQNKKVDLHFADQLSPGVVRPHNDNGYTCVVMPMRI